VGSVSTRSPTIITCLIPHMQQLEDAWVGLPRRVMRMQAMAAQENYAYLNKTGQKLSQICPLSQQQKRNWGKQRFRPRTGNILLIRDEIHLPGTAPLPFQRIRHRNTRMGIAHLFGSMNVLPVRLVLSNRNVRIQVETAGFGSTRF